MIQRRRRRVDIFLNDITDRKGETSMANELILAVDDEAHILELLSFNLEASGYRVVTAATGEDALVVCAHERPAMVLLDIMLPGIDGMEGLPPSEGRSHHGGYPPSIMLTPRATRWTRSWAWSWARTITSPSPSACGS